MGRFCSGLMTCLRVLQLLLSLAALACGAYITYEMFSLGSSAADLETTIKSISTTSVETMDALAVLESLLLPVLHYLEETPVRAIILTAVALWSTCLIIYLMIAQRAANKATENTKLNKRSIRICLEILTLLLWITGIVCATLLATEYGSIIFVGGTEMKFAWTAVKPLVKDAIERSVSTLTTDDGPMLRELDIVDDIFTIGAMSILAVVSAVICGSVSILSLLAACCISGNARKQRSQLEAGQQDQLVPMLHDKSALPVIASPGPLIVNVNGYPSPPTPGPMGYAGSRWS